MKSKQAQNISDAIDWTTTRWRIESISNQVPHQQKPLEWSIHSVMQIKGTTELVGGTMKPKVVSRMTDSHGHHHQISRWLSNEEEWFWNDWFIRSYPLEHHQIIRWGSWAWESATQQLSGTVGPFHSVGALGRDRISRSRQIFYPLEQRLDSLVEAINIPPPSHLKSARAWGSCRLEFHIYSSALSTKVLNRRLRQLVKILELD